MDALNMLTLMYTSTEVSNAQSQGQVAGQPVQPEIEFALFLQQQLWMSSMPACMQGEAAGETSGPFTMDLPENLALLTGAESGTGVLTVGDVLTSATSATGATGGTGTAPTLADLLAALVAELEQILGVIEDVSATSAQTASGTTETETTAGTALTGRLTGLISAWSQVIEQLNAWLADKTNGLYTVSATSLTGQSARPTATLLPWSSVVATENTGAISTLTAGTTPVVPTETASVAGGTGSLALADESGLELPQSIRWFQSVGIIGNLANAAKAAVTQPQTVSTTVDLGNGETGQLSLTRNASRLPGVAQAYSLRLTVPGAETALTATLTVTRLDVLPMAQTAQTLTQVMPGVEYTAPTVQAGPGQFVMPAGADGILAQLLDPITAGLPEVTVQASNQPQLPLETVPTLTANTGAVATAAIDTPAIIANVVSDTAVPVVETLVDDGIPVVRTPEIDLSGGNGITDARLVATEAAALTVDPAQLSTEVVKVHPGMPEVPVRIELKPAQTSTAADTAKAVAVPVTQTVVDAAAVDEQAVATSAWSTDYALENLGLSTETLEALESVLSRSTEPTALKRGEQAASLTSVTQLVDAFNQPQLTMNTTDSLPMQLLQYSQGATGTATYNGLQYLEMAERIMEQVNTLRAGSGGFYQARLSLNPPNLGEMFVNISVRGDAVALQLCVVSTVPKEQLKDSLESLRESLEEAGLYVTDIRVEEIQEQGSDAEDQSGSDSGTDTTDSETSQARSTSPVVNEVTTTTGGRRMVPALGFN